MGKKKNKNKNAEVAVDATPADSVEVTFGIGAPVDVEIAVEAATEIDATPEAVTETEVTPAAVMDAIAAEDADGQSATSTDAAIQVPSNKITDRNEIVQVLESIVFASPKAMSLVRLRNLLNAFDYDTSELSTILEELTVATENRGFQLQKVAGGYQFRTHPKNADVLQKLLEDKPARLSASALEVLAIIAYKQPLTRSEIDAIRGIDSGHLLRGLLEKNLCRTGGHAETPGRPLLYETTPYFLEVFSLGSLDDLPAMDEFKRELAEGAEGGEALGMDVLAADPDFFDKASPLAANPDRGSFDEPSEDKAELPDFGDAPSPT